MKNSTTATKVDGDNGKSVLILHPKKISKPRTTKTDAGVGAGAGAGAGAVVEVKPEKKTMSSPLTRFLMDHKTKKKTDEETTPPLPITNTRIGNTTPQIHGGSYHIPPEEYETFMKIYYTECFKNGQKEYLTETQLKENGPLLVDVDFRYDYSVEERIHRTEHIIDLITLYLQKFKEIYVVDETVKIPFFVFHKDRVNRLNDKNVTKDGIHIIIGIQCINHTLQLLIRKSILEKIPEIWADIPIVNTWDAVFDEGISKGSTNFQLYGSMKPCNEPYRLTHVYIGTYTESGEIEFDPPHLPSQYENIENINKLSVRYPNHTRVEMTDEIIDILHKIQTTSSSAEKMKARDRNNGMNADADADADADDNDDLDEPGRTVQLAEILAIRSTEEMTNCITRFLLTLNLNEYNLRDAFEYIKILPSSYYTDFTKWIRVGWALRNIHKKLFIVWLEFSTKWSGWSWASVEELHDKWTNFDHKSRQGYTIRSIMYWAKIDNPTEYKQVSAKSVESYIDSTLSLSVLMTPEDDNKIRGFTDYDIACVMYHLYKEDYICISVRNNIWYRFKGHSWAEMDSGTTLRHSISCGLRDLYYKKLTKLTKLKLTLPEGDAEKKSADKKIHILLSIIDKLGKTNDKNNIMRECKELFYDGDFIHKVDANPYLMCFKNGVVDFKEKVFRKGNPEDYLAKCTGINYYKLDSETDTPIIQEIEDFMHKLFPNNQLYKYMWEHLASILIGTNVNQTFNMYIGSGQNGKSVLVNLMEQVLGQYKGDVPLTLITQQRTKIGGVSPEIIQLKGTRYAVMQEPSKGDKINEGIMKQLSAGDALTGRAPYMVEAQTFTPQFTLVVCSNEFMEIKSQDHGTWRRIRVVDFESLFTETPRTDDPEKPFQFKLDKGIKDKFNCWKEVFASMLVKIAYETQGNVKDCEKVLESSNSYRKGQDVFSEYLQERVESHFTGALPKGQLLINFKEWYSVNYGTNKINTKDLVSAMDKRFGKIVEGVWKKVRFVQLAHTDNDSDDENNNNNDKCDVNLEEL